MTALKLVIAALLIALTCFVAIWGGTQMVMAYYAGNISAGLANMLIVGGALFACVGGLAMLA